jgi:maleate isomerase
VRSNAKSLTAAGSLVAAIKSLGATKVGFASPYIGEVNDQAAAFLTDVGINVIQRADIGRELGNYGKSKLTPDEAYALARQVDHPQAQAIVLSCTDMRSVEVIERIEDTLGKPVVASNQAMICCLLRTLGLTRHDAAPGRLFDNLT